MSTASAKQMDYIESLASKAGLHSAAQAIHQVTGMSPSKQHSKGVTKAQASEVIEALQAGKIKVGE